MKTKIIKIAAVLLILAGIVSCGKEDNENCSCDNGSNELIVLESTGWKLTGITDVETGMIMELEPKDCSNCYTFYFDTECTARGYSVANTILLRLSPQVSMGVATELYDSDIGDVQLFYDAIKTVISYTVTNDELKLYYNEGKNYLLYKKMEPVHY
jgi:hypothetical protein